MVIVKCYRKVTSLSKTLTGLGDWGLTGDFGKKSFTAAVNTFPPLGL